MSEINWIRMGIEITSMPNGIATLRLLQAHGVQHLVKFNDGGVDIKQACPIEMVINYAHKEKQP